MKVKPMHDRVAAEVIKEETTKSGIIVTTNQPRDTHCAKVVAVGPDVKNITG
jgi:co-chaperonin GroES (HSP10)